MHFLYNWIRQKLIGSWIMVTLSLLLVLICRNSFKKMQCDCLNWMGCCTSRKAKGHGKSITLFWGLQESIIHLKEKLRLAFTIFLIFQEDMIIRFSFKNASLSRWFIATSSCHAVPLSWLNWKLEMLVFDKGGKLNKSWEKLEDQWENPPQTQPKHTGTWLCTCITLSYSQTLSQLPFLHPESIHYD